MGIIDEEQLKYYEEDCENYEQYRNIKAKFNTKIASGMRHNGEIVNVLGILNGRGDVFDDTYIVRFNDDTVEDNVMITELEFRYTRDPVKADMARIFSKIIKEYELTDREVEELRIATSNYSYKVNEGVAFTSVDSIARLFTDEDCEELINPTEKQLKSIAEYIEKTRRYYLHTDYEECTKKVIEIILNKNDITRLELFKEIKEMVEHNISVYSHDFYLGKAKEGYEDEYYRENKKLVLVEQMIKEELQKDKKKNRERGR